MAPEDRLERRAEILWPDRLAVGVPDVGPEPEDVGCAVGAGFGNLGGKVADERSERRSAGPPVRHQPVVDERCRAGGVVLRIASEQELRLRSQRAAAVAGRRRVHRRPYRAVRDCERARAAGHWDGVGRAAGLGVDPSDGRVAVVCDPHSAVACGDRAWVASDGHDVGHRVRRWVDARDRSVLVVGDPHRALGDRDVDRAVPDGDRVGHVARARVDAIHGGALLARHPYRARAGSDRGRNRGEADRRPCPGGEVDANDGRVGLGRDPDRPEACGDRAGRVADRSPLNDAVGRRTDLRDRAVLALGDP